MLEYTYCIGSINTNRLAQKKIAPPTPTHTNFINLNINPIKKLRKAMISEPGNDVSMCACVCVNSCRQYGGAKQRNF